MINNEEMYDELIGTTLKGKYKIIDFIGKGGMGKVYLATNILLGNKWAIKVVSQDYIYAKYFRREAEILEKLNHPNMPKIVDLFEDEENIYIVETYIEGELLSDKILSNKKIDNECVINYFTQISELIEYLHNIKPYPIVYRDLKPNNIIISHNDRLVLVDFSIAKLHDLNSNEDTIIAGNKYYSPKEQLNLTEKSDTRSDIYSLGMLALRMITGRLKEDIKLSSLDEFVEIKPELKEIISRCINPDADKRYQETSELVRDLKLLHNNDVNTKFKDKKVILVDGMASSGKTFIASSMAKIFANEKIKVSYVDLSNELGCAEYFNIKLDENLPQLLLENRLEEIKSKSYKCKKNIEIYKGEIDNEKLLIDFIRKLVKINDVVIIDLNTDEYKEIYNYVDEILLVLTQDEKIENLTNKKVVEYIDKNIELNNVKLVVNKYENNFKNLSELLSDINIIPKIFKSKYRFNEIYKVPELARKELLSICKFKEISYDSNETVDYIEILSKKIFDFELMKRLDTKLSDNFLVAEIKDTYKQFKSEVKKIITKGRKQYNE